MPQNRIPLAKIISPHGVRGRVKVIDFGGLYENLFNKDVWIISKNNTNFIDINVCSVENAKADNFIVEFKDIHSRDQALELNKSLIYINKEDLAELEEDAFYIYQLLGINVIDISGAIVACVVDILDNAVNHIIVAQDLNKKEVLIPFVKAWVEEVNIPKSYIRISSYLSFLQ